MLTAILITLGKLLVILLEVGAVILFVAGIWAIYIHSNVRLPTGPLRWLLGAPELHHWHHDRDRDAGNYANISPLMDLLFGTYRCPDHEPEHFGLYEPPPATYLGHLIRPLLPRRLASQIDVQPALAARDRTHDPVAVPEVSSAGG